MNAKKKVYRIQVDYGILVKERGQSKLYHHATVVKFIGTNCIKVRYDWEDFVAQKMSNIQIRWINRCLAHNRTQMHTCCDDTTILDLGVIL